jgi:hypothetical protein
VYSIDACYYSGIDSVGGGAYFAHTQRGRRHMPILIGGLLLTVVCIFFAVFYLIRKRVNLEKKGLNIVIFILSFISLVISLKLFWNMGAYADEYGSSPVLVSGGWFWLAMNWIKQGVLFILCLITGLKLISDIKNS